MDRRIKESFRNELAWQRAVEMTLLIYRATESFPKAEKFGLMSQLRRAGVSVASNIAEGYGRGSSGEHRQFLGIARGSNYEVQTQLVIALRLEFGSSELLREAEERSFEVGRLLLTRMKTLEKPARAGSRLDG